MISVKDEKHLENIGLNIYNGMREHSEAIPREVNYSIIWRTRL